MHLPFRSEWRLAMWNGFLSGAQSSSRALAMSSSNLFLNIFSINILNYTNPKLYWNFKVCWTRLAMVTPSKSSWQDCRRPKPQHSQQRPWVKWVKVVDRLPKASGLLNLTRMMSPVNSGSKSSVEPGWTFPVKNIYIDKRSLIRHLAKESLRQCQDPRYLAASPHPSPCTRLLITSCFEHFHDLQLAIMLYLSTWG